MKTQMKFSMKRKYVIRRRILTLIMFIILLILIYSTIYLFHNYYEYFSNKDEQMVPATITLQVTDNDEFKHTNKEISYKNIKPNNMTDSLFDMIYNISNNENVPIECMLSIISIENESYNESKCYVNTDGSEDIGLCQVNSNYIDYFGKKYNIPNFNPLNVNDSIIFLARHFKYLTQYANKEGLYGIDAYLFAAGAYNRGLTNETKYQNMYSYKYKFLDTYNDFINNNKEN